MGVSDIGVAIKQRRLSLGITQPHLAELAGISKNTLYKIERGVANPTIQVIGQIASVLGMEIKVVVKNQP